MPLFFLILCLYNLTGVVQAQPATTVDPPTPSALPAATAWHGWMIVDAVHHKIVFLPVEKTLDLSKGVVVEGVLSAPGTYAFKVPYQSEFVGIIVENGRVSALKSIDARCMLAVQPAIIADAQGLPRPATAFGVTGPLMRAVASPQAPTVTVGNCSVYPKQ